MPAPKKINLLVRGGFEGTAWAKILAWALSAGRIVVIVTELIVIAAFLSRFWLDRTLTDLADQNEVLASQIQAVSDFETAFRQAQARLAAYKAWDAQKSGAAELVGQIGQLLPVEVTLTEIALLGPAVELTGITLSEAGLTGLIASLQSSPLFKNVELTDVSLEPTAVVLKFSLKASLSLGKTQAEGGSDGRH